MNPYRCETCKMNKRTECPAFCCEKFMINLVGCASHSDFQSERDKVLDELLVWVKKNNVNHEDSDGDRLPVIVTGKIMNKIAELRTAAKDGDL